jgi:hypothetical protein
MRNLFGRDTEEVRVPPSRSVSQPPAALAAAAPAPAPAAPTDRPIPATTPAPDVPAPLAGARYCEKCRKEHRPDLDVVQARNIPPPAVALDPRAQETPAAAATPAAPSGRGSIHVPAWVRARREAAAQARPAEPGPAAAIAPADPSVGPASATRPADSRGGNNAADGLLSDLSPLLTPSRLRLR